MITRIEREAGTIAVEVHGEGPLILCVPAMGESRASYRHIIPGLVDAGFRVAVMDLRGHGDSSADFDTYDDPATAGDILAVIEELGGAPATVVGNSMGAAAATFAAAENPAAVERLVLIGPFVRDHASAAVKLLMRVVLARPWGPALFHKHYTSLFGEQRPADHDEHVKRAGELLRRPGRWRPFQLTAQTSHAVVEAALPRVEAKTLVIMGSKDPDFKDPEVEAKWIADALSGQYSMIPGAGHYPMGEQPKETLSEMLNFLGAVETNSNGTAGSDK